MLHHTIRKADKLLIRLIIINLLFLVFNQDILGQVVLKDSASFKRDFEKLLSKYGINSSSYIINVSSVNQSGGQTAFVITNNYYGDSVSDFTNFGYSFNNDSTLLTVFPQKGVWQSPFVSTDSLKSNRHFVDPGIGVVATFHGMKIMLDSVEYTLFGVGPDRRCSKRFPLYIYLQKNDPNQFFVFGDIQDSHKTYIYYKGMVSWMLIEE